MAISGFRECSKGMRRTNDASVSLASYSVPMRWYALQSARTSLSGGSNFSYPYRGESGKVRNRRNPATPMGRCEGPQSTRLSHSDLAHPYLRAGRFGRVEVWRGGCRSNISVAAPFVWRVEVPDHLSHLEDGRVP
jgi:hypothetical protein